MIVERYEEGEWVEVTISLLKEGDKFRYFRGEDAHQTAVCASDAYQKDDGVWEVEILEFVEFPPEEL